MPDEVVKVPCKICGKKFEKVGFHVRKKHGMSMTDYRNLPVPALQEPSGIKTEMPAVVSSKTNEPATKETMRQRLKRGRRQSSKRRGPGTKSSSSGSYETHILHPEFRRSDGRCPAARNGCVQLHGRAVEIEFAVSCRPSQLQ